MDNKQVIGIDFYSGNSDVWEFVAKHQPAFAFIGATRGIETYFQRYGGRSFDSDWAAAQKAHLLRGAYHLYIEGIDPGQQSQSFLNLVSSVGGDNELPLALDVETLAGHPFPQAAGVLEWLQRVEAATHRRPIIYTSAHMWEITVKSADWASHYDLWVAAYPNDSALGYHEPLQHWQPAIPDDWKHKELSWKFWQYADIGVDLNVFAGNADELQTYTRSYAAGHVVTPPVTTSDCAGAWRSVTPSDGLLVRREPGGDRIDALPVGTRICIDLMNTVAKEGHTWVKILAAPDHPLAVHGWCVVEFLGEPMH